MIVSISVSFSFGLIRAPWFGNFGNLFQEVDVPF